MDDSEFDIIIVGGGTAGCVLASRLSTSTDLRILLLEAGANRNGDPKVQMPLTSRQMSGDPNYDWDFETTSQIDLEGRVIHHPRGRMLGGSSAINSHSLVFPNKDMHDTWAKIINDDTWSWDQMKECYARFLEEVHASEDDDSINDLVDPCKIKASFPHQSNKLQQAWEDVFEALGMKSQKDGVSGECFGGFTTTNAIDNGPAKGERSHAGNAYLQPILGRNNLVVETEALVHRIVFNNETSNPDIKLTATGVVCESHGHKRFIKANQEVILCAGAFGSPQLLELSGIGRRDVIEKATIKCLFELPGVGEKLQDHINFGPSVEVCSDIETMDAAVREPSIMATHRDQYLKTRTGLLAEGAAYSFAFWPLQLFNTPSEEAELKSLLDLSMDLEQDKMHPLRKDFIRRMVLSPDEASATVFMTRIQRYTDAKTRADGNYMTVVAMLSHPLSDGSVHIKSSDANDKPIIDCAYLSHPLDAEVLARHCLQIESLLRQPVYESVVKQDGRRLPRGFEKRFSTIGEIKSVIKLYGATNYHPCGTCAMMSLTDEGVVDGGLKVYGTKNLRVCDASVFPIIPRGNILTTVYAVAEKMVEIMLRDYQKE